MDVWLITEADNAAGLDPVIRLPMQAIADHFIAAGDRLTWLHFGAPFGATEPDGVTFWHYRGSPARIFPSWLKNSVDAFEQARLRRPDLIVGQDRAAPAFGCSTARYCGTALDETRVVTLIADPTSRALSRAKTFPSDLVTLGRSHIEAASAAQSDAVLFADPSAEDWVRSAGWALPTTLVSIADVAAWARRPMPPGVPRETVTVSVIVAHYERPPLLAQALDALAVQSDPAFELIVVDDGSKTEAARRFLETLETHGHAGLKPRILRQSNRYLGAARNAAIAHASGSHVILLDDDNVPFPTMVETFRRAAEQSGADIISCQMQRFRGDAAPSPALLPTAERWAFPAGPVALAPIANVFGDATAIYRRDIFARVGPFHERYGIGHEDWQFYLRAALAGASMLSLPCALFWYRHTETSMLAVTDPYENAMVVHDTLAEALHPALRPLVGLIRGLALPYELRGD